MSVGGRNEQKVWVRGYEQSNVLLLVDGVPIADPYYGDLDLGQLPLFDVARVSVTRGAASPLYGPNGLGGVINVTTMQGGPGTRVAGDLRLTRERTAVAHASVGGGDVLSWYFGLGAETSDGWPMAGGFKETASPENTILIRQGPNNEPIPIIIDLKNAMYGQGDGVNLALLPNDIVYIPKSAIAEANKFVIYDRNPVTLAGEYAAENGLGEATGRGPDRLQHPEPNVRARPTVLGSDRPLR